jgi:hypothetical protein
VAPTALLFLYLIGGALVAGGIYVVAHGAFPTWVTGRLLWPLVTVTPVIAVLQGWASLSFGVAVLAFSFAPFAPVAAIGGLQALAGVGAAAGSLLFGFSTWISRRPSPGAPPRRP